MSKITVYACIATILLILGAGALSQAAEEQSSGALPEAKNITNSIGMQLVRIEPGSFKMGSETGGDFDEKPVHRVTISRPFYMGRTEVTNAQYEKFDPSHSTYRGKLGFSKDDDEAVVFVTWHDAVRFCRWLSKKEGRNYRLPTEAEWEYAARAGTTAAFSCGDKLPEEFHKNQKTEWSPVPVKIHVAKTRPNPWGLHDMHGNVEEWCDDWYGPYSSGDATDPFGPTDGDFKVTRGGSHSTPVAYLRSANRMGTLPEDNHFLIGFRVVLAEPGEAKPSEAVAETKKPLWAKNVKQKRHDFVDKPDPARPYFKGPRQYVFIPPNSDGPMFSKHNHQPAITACPNGDLFAVWYTCKEEPGRELGVVASRLRLGSDKWETAGPFWDAPDRNDHGNALWWDGDKTIYHFNGLSTDATWGKLAIVMRTSTDNGATWSKGRLIQPEHSLHHQVISNVFRTDDGKIIFTCDAVPGGQGGSAIQVSADGGKTWYDPGEGRPQPKFEPGVPGAWIAGIHAGCTQLGSGPLMALGRGDNIKKQMPKSISTDMGKNWNYEASGLPRIGGGQRLVLRRLIEGPLLLVSFDKNLKLRD
ncbi:MAG: SUMF1/EgtB/PvdO family nonheme iron enzyme, partial [Pirellulales bacterium]|nr:SUMF1/EgtB/PvdO family nonheme iron enzyme [Pirellulales bacterium]